MTRAFFAAIGACVLLVGLQLACCEKIIWRYKPEPNRFGFTRVQANKAEYVPVEYHPWGYITGGVVICLYSYTLKRGGK